MSDITDTPVPEDAQVAPQAPPLEGDLPESQEPTATTSTEADDVEALKRELAAARREAARYRTRAKAADEEAEARRIAELSEAEQLQERLAKAEAAAEAAHQRAQDTLKTAAIVAEASKAGAVDAEAVVKLLDASSIEVADDGTVKGASEAVQALLNARPYLRATTAGSPGNPNPGAKAETSEQRRNRLYGLGSFFDGGVQINP